MVNPNFCLGLMEDRFSNLFAFILKGYHATNCLRVIPGPFSLLTPLVY